MPTYTEGIYGDQPAILKDGELVTFDEVLKDLNEATEGHAVLSNSTDLLCGDKYDLEIIAHTITAEHIGNKWGPPTDHWCYDNLYKVVLFTLNKLKETTR